MGQLAAKKGDQIVANDTHTVMVPAGSGEAPVQTLHPFNGSIDRDLSSNVNIMGSPAATTDSLASDPNHRQLPPVPPNGTRFFIIPENKGQTTHGSPSVRINGRPAVRNGDAAKTCDEASSQPIGTVVVAVGSVLFG
jgi:uncharacterized Zn-binding protein involved in type VI secretion